MLPYLPKGLSMKHLGLFMNQTFSGRLNEDKIKAIRDTWKGKLVVKGIVTDEDAEKVLALGADGFICSNHGGRQLDAGQSTIKPMTELAKKYGGRTTVMMDSGLRAGPDVACALASGAKFTFLGRSFMYGVGALGKDGGLHTITMLKRQLQQVMEQLGCAKRRGLSQAPGLVRRRSDESRRNSNARTTAAPNRPASRSAAARAPTVYGRGVHKTSTSVMTLPTTG